MINFQFNINSKQLEKSIRNNINKNLSKKILNEAKDSIRNSLNYNVNRIVRDEVYRYAPEYFIEKQILNLGVDDKSRNVGSVNVSSNFMKEPQFLYLKDAIMRYAKFVIQTESSGNLLNINISLSESSKKKINNAIGFAWMKQVGKNQLERRSTADANAYKPTWNQLLDMWEFGGASASFTVKPRDGTGKLHPGPDKRISSSYVVKTIKPHRMFYLGMKSSKNKILNSIQNTLKKRFKQ